MQRLPNKPLSSIVPLIYMVLILIGASVPADSDSEPHLLEFLLLPPTFQNLLHIPVYGLLAFLWRWTLDRHMSSRAAFILALLITVCFGAFQEWVQSLVPGRFGSVNDVFFDAIGAVLGLWVFSRLTRGNNHPDHSQ
ncbi:VanZ family protein [Desulfonatronum thiodismutans]|uniref:VanZ family protein n=1 Tax=Desulfonatronum thiodismutans TaxID=159290 RepID=UPI0004ABEA17|nr:VanZ family protein [Desulfonatronum thiodismutans]